MTGKLLIYIAVIFSFCFCFRFYSKWLFGHLSTFKWRFLTAAPATSHLADSLRKKNEQCNNKPEIQSEDINNNNLYNLLLVWVSDDVPFNSGFIFPLPLMAFFLKGDLKTVEYPSLWNWRNSRKEEWGQRAVAVWIAQHTEASVFTGPEEKSRDNMTFACWLLESGFPCRKSNNYRVKGRAASVR